MLDDAAAIGLPRDDFRVGPDAVMGIEVNRYAAELARLTVWITELQWQLRKGLGIERRPILDKLDGIVRADALIMHSGEDNAWPEADVVIGNPPFLGGKLMRNSLGDDYVDRLFATFAGRVPAEADLVGYWFAKAWEQMREGRLKCAGLVATNSIRGGANRRILDRIARDGVIFDAWDDEPWVLDGAAVRVSLVCFSRRVSGEEVRLDGRYVQRINPDLTAAFDLTAAVSLAENAGVAFSGISKKGKFEIPGNIAREWLGMPLNPNGRANSDVLFPWWNGDDLVGRIRDYRIINCGEKSLAESAFYEKPFSYLERVVHPVRRKSRSDLERNNWWKLARRAPTMFTAARSLRIPCDA